MSITGAQHPCGRTRRIVNKLTIALEAAKAICGASALYRGLDDFGKDGKAAAQCSRQATGRRSA
jgi:hypothetical protein